MHDCTFADLPLQALLMAVWRRNPKPSSIFILIKAPSLATVSCKSSSNSTNWPPALSAAGTSGITRSWRPSLPAQARADPAQEIQNPRRSTARRGRLHRVLLQPATQTRYKRDAITNCLRTVAEAAAARPFQNYVLFTSKIGAIQFGHILLGFLRDLGLREPPSEW